MTDKTPAQLADDAAEAIRAVNHLTRSLGSEGWQYPGDAYSVVGNLSEAAMRLGQALNQVAAFVRELHDEGHLRSDKDTLDADVNAATGGLYDAFDASQQLYEALNRAHSGLSPIAYKD